MEEQTMNLQQQLNIHIKYPHDTNKFWMENSLAEWNPQKFALDCAIAAPVLLLSGYDGHLYMISHLCSMSFFSFYAGKS
uniref:Uncharacterized protein n=1 Tax=Kalanchoe fedtschenkoi TaxID=63787 RepID=A0A7N0ZZT3_KALFE